ncbi:hypothetical protein KP509_03G030000 [Ceratopteris richardii]|nr:hypothetical protein KP509_03G030000 [Ceratopteris richardii]
MPDSFSWSYKRSYKTGFIWQDLSNDDIIYPLQRNEYVLMGFELQVAPNQGWKSCMCDSPDDENTTTPLGVYTSVGSSKPHDVLSEGALSDCFNGTQKDHHLRKKFTSLSDSVGRITYNHGNSSAHVQSDKKLHASRASFPDSDGLQPKQSIRCVEAATELPLDLNVNVFPWMQGINSEVKVYKAMGAQQTSDAATQTGESKRCSASDETMTRTSVWRQVTNYADACVLHEPIQRSMSGSSNSLRVLIAPRNHFSVFHRSGSDIRETHRRAGSPINDQSGNGFGSVNASTPNKSDVFCSPSSANSSSITQLETTSPSSERSLRSMGSVNSSRFSTTNHRMLASTVDDYLRHTSSTASGRDINDLRATAPLSPFKAAVKQRWSSSTYLLKQLLSCGSLDISESSVLHLKSMSLQGNIVHPGASSGGGTPMASCTTNDTPGKSTGEVIVQKSSRCKAQLLFASSSSSNSSNSSTASTRNGAFSRQLSYLDDGSPPITPKSWLCGACGGGGGAAGDSSRSSSLTSELQIPRRCQSDSHSLSRECSLKDVDVNAQAKATQFN